MYSPGHHRGRGYADKIIATISHALVMLLIFSASLPAAGPNYVTSDVPPDQNYRADNVGGELAGMDTLKQQAGASLAMAQAMNSAAQAG